MSETRTMTLSEFLAARLDEDEAVARAACYPPDVPEAWKIEPVLDPGVPGEARITGIWVNVGDTVTPGYIDPDQAPHISRHDPARVLREVEAKRTIVTACVAFGGHGCDSQHDQEAGEILAHLAAVYADHPDYRDEWRA